MSLPRVGDDVDIDGVTVEILAVGEYDPPDQSVGITGGLLEISCSNGKDYWVWDDGSVHSQDEPSMIVGNVGELHDDTDFPDDVI